jgi:hypothetical protein
MKHYSFLLLITVLILFSFNSFGQPWELKTEENGVKVYTRPIEGSNVLEFKAEVTVKSNMSGILDIIDSVSEYPRWMKNCLEAERLKKVSNSSGYSYYVIDAPWPVADRDACVYYKVTQDTTTRIITIAIKAVKDYIPAKPDRVRIPSLNGTWQLIPTSKGVTKIIYQVHCDIGGLVPAILVNAYITDTPVSNLSKIKLIVESPLYPKRMRPGVREL